MSLSTLLPGLKEVPKDKLTLLGSPILPESIPHATTKVSGLVRTICDRIKLLDAHTGLFFLTHHTSAPRLNYLLRSAPLYKNKDVLDEIDDYVKSTAIQVTNVAIDDKAWTQAALPTRFGGLGLRSVGSLALPCYLSSLNKSQGLMKKIINSPPEVEYTELNQARLQFTSSYPTAEPRSTHRRCSQ